MILEIKSPSCRLAGQILCSHLVKMLFALYNVNPVLSNQETNINQTTSSIKKFCKIIFNNFLK